MRIGFTCGSFDLLHTGHMLMLQDAKAQCDHLIVGLNIDPTIDRKDKNKPVQHWVERLVLLRGCKYIDEVIPYTGEKELLQLLLHIPIDIRIVGKDWKNKGFTGIELSNIGNTVNWKHKIYWHPREHEYSSTELRQRVCKAGKNLQPASIE
jgi:glycerol-3-phosphate cytidylyltransferase